MNDPNNWLPIFRIFATFVFAGAAMACIGLLLRSKRKSSIADNNKEKISRKT